MNVAILLALGAMAAGGVADLLFKIAQNRGIRPATFIFYQSTTFTVTIYTIAIVSGAITPIIRPTVVFGIPAGLLSYAGVLMFVTSLKEGNASVYSPIFRLSFVVTSLGAILVLHEPMTLAKALGTLLAVVGVLSLANLSALGTMSRPRVRSMLLLLGATALFGIVGVLNKEATNQGSQTIPLIVVTSAVFTSSALVRMLTTREIRPNRTTLRMAPGVGLLQLTWTGLLIQSLQTGDASISFPIVQLSFVLTAVLAVVILKERVNRGMVIGLPAAVLAVVAFAFA